MDTTYSRQAIIDFLISSDHFGHCQCHASIGAFHTGIVPLKTKQTLQPWVDITKHQQQKRGGTRDLPNPTESEKKATVDILQPAGQTQPTTALNQRCCCLCPAPAAPRTGRRPFTNKYMVRSKLRWIAGLSQEFHILAP